MTRRTPSEGDIEGPAGQAPGAAWAPVGEEVSRPEDVWLSGDVSALTGGGFEDWKSRVRERVAVPKELSGLRIRFVRRHLDDSDLDLASLTRAVLSIVPEVDRGLFLHSEVMLGPETGLYLAFENRLPALVTQVRLEAGKSASGTLPVLTGPLHVNLLLHDDVGYSEALAESRWSSLLEQIADLLQGGFSISQLHELSMARSDLFESGFSLGVEQVWEEQGAVGGNSAAEAGSRWLGDSSLIQGRERQEEI